MSDGNKNLQKPTLDKDLAKIVKLENAAGFISKGFAGQGLSLIFLVLVGSIAAILTTGESGSVIIVAAAVLGGYMALNIGANDVANNVGPAVGANALSLTGALIIAAVFESAGA
ncbi:MAG: inorganic phosphate transporter, partial [Pikeienuella sp.]